MKTKALLLSTLLTLFSAGTVTHAGDNDYLSIAADTTTAQPFVIKHAFLITSSVEKMNELEFSSK